MSNRKNFDDWFDGVYNSMNDAERATPSPFLLTQVLQKKSMQKNFSRWEYITAWLTRPAVAFAMLLIIICMNVFIINGNSKTQSFRSDIQNDIFNTSISGVYDVDNITP